METAVSARPDMTANGGRSNGVRPSLSSAYTFPLLSYGPPAPEPTRLHSPDTCSEHQPEPCKNLGPTCTPACVTPELTCSYCLSRGTVKHVPLLSARRVLTAGRPVCVLTDLSSRLEEEYAVPQKMSSLSNLGFLVAGHQDDRPAEQAGRAPWRHDPTQMPPTGRRRPPRGRRRTRAGRVGRVHRPRRSPPEALAGGYALVADLRAAGGRHPADERLRGWSRNCRRPVTASPSCGSPAPSAGTSPPARQSIIRTWVR